MNRLPMPKTAANAARREPGEASALLHMVPDGTSVPAPAKCHNRTLRGTRRSRVTEPSRRQMTTLQAGGWLDAIGARASRFSRPARDALVVVGILRAFYFFFVQDIRPWEFAGVDARAYWGIDLAHPYAGSGVGESPPTSTRRRSRSCRAVLGAAVPGLLRAVDGRPGRDLRLARATVAVGRPDPRPADHLRAVRRQHPLPHRRRHRSSASECRRRGPSRSSRRSPRAWASRGSLVRREWRDLAIALGVTRRDRGRLVRPRTRPRGPTGSPSCSPPRERSCCSSWSRGRRAVLVAFGAWTGRRWLVPVAVWLALPIIWINSWVILLAIIRLRADAAPAGRRSVP